MEDQKAPTNWRALTTISIPQAGVVLGLRSKNTAYAAADRGEIPVIKLGRLRRVPVAQLVRMLDGASRETA